jgi:hypothetical protein
MTVTILILFGSAFFTDVIGVHAIFGSTSILCAICDSSDLYPQGRS